MATTEELLGRCVGAWCPGATGIDNAKRLSGGASQETWSFDIVRPGGVIGAILRRAPQGYGAGGLYSSIASDVIRASAEERHANPRSSSAKLRYAVRGASS